MRPPAEDRSATRTQSTLMSSIPTYDRSGEGSGRGGGRGLSAMTNVFISYSRDDKDLADKIRRALADAGVATSTADDTDPPGARWRETLVKKLDKADAVVAVVSKSTVESSWTMTELGIAWGANKKIIGVLASGEPPDELGISPLKDVKLLRVAKTDMAQLAAEILEATSDPPHRQET